MHKHAKAVLIIPNATKFVPKVWKTILHQRNEVHVVQTDQMAKLLLGRDVGHVCFTLFALVTVEFLKLGIFCQKSFQYSGCYFSFMIKQPLDGGPLFVCQGRFVSTLRITYDRDDPIRRVI